VENEIDHLLFVSENAAVVTFCHTANFPPTIGLLCTVTPLLMQLLILVVVVTPKIETTVPALCSKKSKFLGSFFFFENLKYSINKINHFYRRLKNCIGSKRFCSVSFVMHLPEDGHKCGRNV